MMGSLMADLEKNLNSINKWLKKNDKPELTQDELLIKLFNEVERTWPMVGYPPLVTPYSQYVKNLSLMNVLQEIKGRGRFSMIDENTWGMILGKSGKLPGAVDDKLKEMAKSQDREFFDGNPQDLYPDVLPEFRKKMNEKSWETSLDDEELFEYAMHPEQYEDYKSGNARKKFLEDLEKRKQADEAARSPIVASNNGQHSAVAAHQPKKLFVEVEGEKFEVNISYDEEMQTSVKQDKLDSPQTASPDAKTINSPLECKFFLTKNSSEKGIVVGDQVNPRDTVAYVESMKVINAITSSESGTVKQILVKHGDDIEEDAQLIILE
jgi:pyruvate carboxylase subunit B